MAATFTIAIPARNGMPFVCEAIASALVQSRPADEILVVDDASTDGTLELAEALAREGWLRVHRNPAPTGFADAWNRAAALATGEFVAVLHQDDLLHPRFLERVAAAQERFPDVGHLYAACDVIDGRGRVLRPAPAGGEAGPVRHGGREYSRRYLRAAAANRHLHRCPGVATRRALLTGPCRWRAEAGQIADDDLFTRIGAFTDVVGIAEPLASYREHAGSTTAGLDSLTLALARDYLWQVRARAADPGALGPKELALLRGLALRFVNRLLVEGVRGGRADRVGRARELRVELEALCPGFAEAALPAWARPLWALAAGGREPGAAARLWVRAIDAAVGARDLLRGRGARQ